MATYVGDLDGLLTGSNVTPTLLAVIRKGRIDGEPWLNGKFRQEQGEVRWQLRQPQ